MRCELLFGFLLMSLCIASDIEDKGNIKIGVGLDLDIGDKYDCGDDDECDGEYKKYIYEPCDYSDDIYCVRKFFKDYAQCSVIDHESYKPVYRDKHTAFVPKVNLTVVTTKVRLTKLDGKISKFYVNKKSNNLVMTVDFDGIEIVSKKLFFIVSRVGKEPAVAADYANGTYALTLTAVFPLIDGNINIKGTIVSTYNPNPYPDFYMGPKITNNKDPAIALAVAGVYADVPTIITEFLLGEGPNFFLAYLQKYICDFGIPLSE